MTTSTFTIIPITNNSFFSYTTTLDDLDVRLTFQWNSRTEHYHVDIQLRDGTYIMQGQKLTVGSYQLTTNTFNSGMKGGLILFPVNDSVVESAETRKSWASNYILSYVS